MRADKNQLLEVQVKEKRGIIEKRGGGGRTEETKYK